MKVLVIFILIFAIFLAFIVLNLNNTCDISFGFKTLENVPVFLSSLCSFMVGILLAVPIGILMRRKKPALPKKLSKKAEKQIPPDTGANEINIKDNPYGID